MKENKISRRSFLKFSAAASAAGMMAAAPVAASAAQPDAAAAEDEENGLLDLFKKPKYIFLFIGDRSSLPASTRAPWTTTAL